MDLRNKKEEIVQLQARYEKLYDWNQPIRNSVEMAQLAERLGRVFEARGFLTIAIAYDPKRGDLRRELERLNRKPVTAIEREQSYLRGQLTGSTITQTST